MEQMTFEEVQKRVNYVVTTQGWTGEDITECETEDEVWKAIGKASFGAIYSVKSPTDKSLHEFVPF